MLAFVNLCSPTERLKLDNYIFCRVLAFVNLCSPTESEEHGFCFLKLSLHCVGCWFELDGCTGLPAVSCYEPV